MGTTQIGAKMCNRELLPLETAVRSYVVSGGFDFVEQHIACATLEKNDSISRFRMNLADTQDRTLVNDHALENVMQGKRAFSISSDYRVIYLERDEYYLFVDVGTHDQVYRR